MRTKKIFLLAGLVFSAFVVSGEQIINNTAPAKSGSGFNLIEIMIPVIIGILGYLGKSVYEIYVNRQKRKRELLEDKLKNFYWPIYIRLKKNEDTYRLLFKGKMKTDSDSIDYKISHYVEKEVLLKNHEEILEIITNYRHLAETDTNFEQLTDEYIKHVTIYQGFLHAGINEYPGVKADAPYPTGIDDYFFKKTKVLQEKLERLTF